MELKERPNYILDAQTKAGDRMTSFALDLKDALLDFQSWVDAMSVKTEDLWYADVFEFLTQHHAATVSLNDKGLAIIEPASPTSKLKPFKRNRFIARLKGELR